MQTGFYFDQTRCTGCFACTIACKDWHDTPAGPANWIRVLYSEQGKFPELLVSHVATPCYHCAEPVCAFVCPNEAIAKRDEDGIVVVDRDKCRRDKPCGIVLETAMGSDFLYGETDAPCQIACPVHLNVPGYAALIAKGRFKEALELIRRRMPLPSVCGRVCLHPCETECRRQELDQSIAIEALKRFVADNVAEGLPDRLPVWQKDKVAVLGSGPAGLAAAYDLVRMGYGVTVFEALPVAGGMLSVGIPEHRLPKQVLKRDIDYIEALGVEIRTNCRVDLGRGLDELFGQGYGAVLLALGAHKGLKMDIPGADLEGSWAGTSFMSRLNLGKTPSVGQKVLVVGGGNVALDCARSARRLGAKEVDVVCLECREGMPADVAEVEQAEEEGIRIHPSCAITRILDDAGAVRAAECQEVTQLRFDDNGQPHFDPVEGSLQILLADTVIFAVGQAPDLSGLPREGAVGTSDAGTILADPDTMMTGRQGVFAAGDSVAGPTSIVDAIASGQKAAFHIDRYLQDDVVAVRAKKGLTAADIKVELPASVAREERQPMPMLPVAERLSSFREVALGFSPEVAMAEGKRCLNCAGHLCKDVCPYDAPQFADEDKARMQKCDLCLDRWAEDLKPICVEACPARALDAGSLEELKRVRGDEKQAQGFVYSATAQPSIVSKRKRARW